MYRIVRYSYGYTHNMDNDEDGIFLFETEREAYKCLELCFNNGEYFDDEQYGRIKYYVESFNHEYHYDGRENNFSYCD